MTGGEETLDLRNLPPLLTVTGYSSGRFALMTVTIVTIVTPFGFRPPASECPCLSCRRFPVAAH